MTHPARPPAGGLFMSSDPVAPGAQRGRRAPVAATAAVALTLAFACATPAVAQQDARASFGDRWRDLRAEVVDPADGMLDVGPVLERARGFLPIPIIVTEPAVGYGGGLAAMFVRPRRDVGQEGFARPNLSVAGAVFTENGTRLFFAADSSLWQDGRLKSTAGAGGGNINLDVYGLGGTADKLDSPIRYTLAMRAAGGQVDWQIAPRSPWWIGLRLVYAEITPKLRDDPRFPGLEDRTRTTLAGPGVQLTYDSRDNLFTPTFGVYAETSLIAFDAAFGATRDFQRFSQVAMAWWPATPRVTGAVRADYQQVSGDAPFYARPYIALRGIPAMRYPGDSVASAQAEVRWQFHGRWSVVAFGGAGLARIDDGPAQRTKHAGAGGLGFRYEIAHRFGMHVGIDVARGPEDTAVYLQIGNAWFRP